MSSRTDIVVPLLLCLLAQACATTDAPGPEPESDPIAEILPPLDDSDAERCIRLSQIASTRVLDSSTIEFQMRGGKTYINILPHRCVGLRPGQPFMYRTSLNVLCDLDLITVLDTGGFGFRPMGSCGLGRFRPALEGGPDVILEDEPE